MLSNGPGIIRGRMIPKIFFSSKLADFCCGGIFSGEKCILDGFLGYNFVKFGWGVE